MNLNRATATAMNLNLADLQQKVAEIVLASNQADPVETEASNEIIPTNQANEIKDISKIIAEKIINNIGSEGKIRLTQQVKEVNLQKSPLELMMGLTMQNAKSYSSATQNPSFTEVQKKAFYEAAAKKTEVLIRQSLMNFRALFVEKGLSINLTDQEPLEFLEEIIHESGIRMNFADIPRKYSILLNLDKTETQHHKSTLIISQKIQGTVFEEIKYPLKELNLLS
jgi:hypothetical protein